MDRRRILYVLVGVLAFDSVAPVARSIWPHQPAVSRKSSSRTATWDSGDCGATSASAPIRGEVHKIAFRPRFELPPGGPMVLAMAPVITQSTINPSVPAQGSSLSSAPIRQNFQAAFNDINNLILQAVQPPTPVILPNLSVAALPVCNAGLQGAVASTNNASQAMTSANYGATVSSTPGANVLKIYCTGTNWVID